MRDTLFEKADKFGWRPNAVKHGLVVAANQYPWCSAGWFEEHATQVQVRTAYRFKTDQLNIYDDDEPFCG